jgi:hypothetical protein
MGGRPRDIKRVKYIYASKYVLNDGSMISYNWAFFYRLAKKEEIFEYKAQQI